MTRRAARSAFRFGAERVASSEWLMGIVYDTMNASNFEGLGAHEEMLSDRVRVDAYHRAIRAAVSPGDVVLDLGTGTGLLAMMASRAGAAKVYAIEHSNLIDVAREVARHNGITNIEFVQVKSSEFTPPEPIDVVLHEQMGDELFNENMVENLLDLRRRVLRPTARIVPSRFRLFVEPVVMTDPFRVRRIWNSELPDGLDLSVLERSPVADRFRSRADDQTWARPGSISATVGDPAPLLDFDLNTLEDPAQLVGRHHLERTAGDDVIVDGICVWFEAIFDESNTLTTSPLSTNTSWGNRLYRVDREVSAGDIFRYTVAINSLVDASTWDVFPAPPN